MATYATNSYSLTSVYNLTNSLLVLSPFFIFFHRFAAYGATKRSVVHLTKSLQAELQMQDVKNVVVHNLSVSFVMVK